MASKSTESIKEQVEIISNLLLALVVGIHTKGEQGSMSTTEVKIKVNDITTKLNSELDIISMKINNISKQIKLKDKNIYDLTQYNTALSKANKEEYRQLNINVSSSQEQWDEVFGMRWRWEMIMMALYNLNEYISSSRYSEKIRF